MMHKSGPVVLMILDGWGYRENNSHNAIALAHTPQWDTWWKTCPHVLLEASGSFVGLPDGQMGNSEVGHMHIGAGRVILQDYTRINKSIDSYEFANNTTFIETIHEMQQSGHAIHILGLLSAGGIHSHETHLFAFLALCATMQFSRIYLHLFLDGRDTAPQSAMQSLNKLQEILKKYPVAEISSLSGRYYAMDRDNRWQRIERTYHVLTGSNDPNIPHYESATAAISAFYQQQIFDEFIPPTFIGHATPIKDGDSVFFFNFRADRARQLTHALIDEAFDAFHRPLKPHIARFISMTHYADALATQAAYPPQQLQHTLGEVIAQHGLHQLRIAETEKYAHVTFFLNGGREASFPNEDRTLIPSPAIATYDLQPEMSALKLTRSIIEAIQSAHYDVIICNYANADMVGHSGNLTATIKAIESLDNAMHDVSKALTNVGGHLLITADHGNAELMFDEKTQQVHTAHTCDPVPLLYVGDNHLHFKLGVGSLIDVAPTLLALLKINPPSEMTGRSLWMENDA